MWATTRPPVSLEWARRLVAAAARRPPLAIGPRHAARRLTYSAADTGTEQTATDQNAKTAGPYDHLKRRGPFQPAKASDALPPGRIRPEVPSRKHKPLVVAADHFGPWKELLFDYDRLVFETGLDGERSGERPAPGQQRSVDDPAHATDFALWTALFNFAHRRDGGTTNPTNPTTSTNPTQTQAFLVWQQVVERRQLCDASTPMARQFWAAVLAAALDDDVFLASVHAYAEWLLAAHDVAWPGLHDTTVRHLLDAGEYERALHWHRQLAPSFAVHRRDLAALLRDYLVEADDEPELHDVLQDMYRASQHRGLYDVVVPLLYARGNSVMARAWRQVCLAQDDGPATSVSRPFLQFLRGYYPALTPHASELRCLRPLGVHDADDNDNERNTRGMSFVHPTEGRLPANLFQYMNQVHGQTFGIREKNVLNDDMGSKWFATKFVSLDTAISLLYTLGVGEIGPLALQSLALREATVAGVRQRLAQLEQCQISTGRSSYSQAVRHAVAANDADTLRLLLTSQLDPSVFDDIVRQRQVLGLAAFRGDYATQRLIMAVRVATSGTGIEASMNSLLLLCLERGKKALALKLLDEFAARGTPLLPATSRQICHFLLKQTALQPSFLKHVPDHEFLVPLCLRLLALRQPVPAQALRNLLSTLGRSGRMFKLERVALDIVAAYRRLQRRPAVRADANADANTDADTDKVPPVVQPMALDETSGFKIYVGDTPRTVRHRPWLEGDAHEPDHEHDHDEHDHDDDHDHDTGYRMVPRDLPLDHHSHPLAQIFDSTMQRSIVRWYFYRLASQRPGHKPAARDGEVGHDGGRTRTGTGNDLDAYPIRYSVAAGVRLLTLLRARGVHVRAGLVRNEVLVCALALLGPPAAVTNNWENARARNQYTLADIKRLCDAAWPPLARPPTEREADDAHKEELLQNGTHTAPPGRAMYASATPTLLPPLASIESALDALARVVPGAPGAGNRVARSEAHSAARKQLQAAYVADALAPFEIGRR